MNNSLQHVPGEPRRRPQTTRHIIAIDPDVDRSGVAFLHLPSRELHCEAKTFPELIDDLHATKQATDALEESLTVVVEAGARSGALATARRAMEYGRELGAVPGPVDAPMSVGCLELARNGATIIRDGRDALELVRPVSVEGTEPLFGMPIEEDRGIAALEPIQRRVWEALPRRAPSSVEAICIAAGLSRAEVNRALMDLSVAGLVSGSTRGWARAGGSRS